MSNTETADGRRGAVARPCRECPFRRQDGVPGWCGTAAPEEYLLDVQADVPLPCHETIDYEDADWYAKWVNGRAGKLCAGALIMAANLCKRSRDPHRPIMAADRETVYATARDMVESHRAARVTSWSAARDALPSVVELRARLGLDAPSAEERR